MSAVRFVLLTSFLIAVVVLALYPKQWTTWASKEDSVVPVQSPVSVGKPNVPIALEAKASGVAEIGSPVIVQIETYPKVDAPLFSIDVRPPAGVTVQSGNLQWEGPLSKGQKKQHTVTLALAERERKTVTILVGIHFNDGSRVYKAAEVTLVPTGTFKASPPGVIIDRGGARVIEHKGVER